MHILIKHVIHCTVNPEYKIYIYVYLYVYFVFRIYSKTCLIIIDMQISKRNMYEVYIDMNI